MVRPVDYAALTERKCSKCGEVKPVAEFNRYDDPSAVLTGWRYYSWCRACSNERSRQYGTENRARRNTRLRAWRKANPEAAREKDRAAKRARYGLTAEAEAAAFAKFGGKCWLCRSRPAKVRDHDHETGAFRGVLCHGCNSITVARADADPDYLKRVAAYIANPELACTCNPEHCYSDQDERERDECTYCLQNPTAECPAHAEAESGDWYGWPA